MQALAVASVTEHDDGHLSAVDEPRVPSLDRPDFVNLPVFDVRASAGGGLPVARAKIRCERHSQARGLREGRCAEKYGTDEGQNCLDLRGSETA